MALVFHWCWNKSSTLKKTGTANISNFLPYTVVPSPSIRCKRRILENDKRLSKIGGRGTWKEKFAERVRRFSMHAGIHQIESEFGKFTCSALNLQIETGTQEIINGVLLLAKYQLYSWGSQF